MKKTLIALAVLGAFGAAHAQSNVTIYGQLQPSYDMLKSESAAGVDTKVQQMHSNASRIGFKGTEDLGGGLKAVFQLEQQVDFVNAGGLAAARNSFVGVDSKFGTLTFGNIDSAYKTSTGKYDPFADTMSDYNSIMGRSAAGVNVADLRNRQAINYVSPNFNGVTVSANYALGAAAKTDTDNAGRTDLSTYGAAVDYTNGPLNLVAAYERVKQDTAAAAAIDSLASYKLGVAYTLPTKTTIRGIYEKLDDSTTIEVKHWLVGVEHPVTSNITVMANYIKADENRSVSTSEADAINLGVNYAFSKRTNLTAVYTKVDNDGTANYQSVSYAPAAAGAEVTGISARLQHKF